MVCMPLGPTPVRVRDVQGQQYAPCSQRRTNPRRDLARNSRCYVVRYTKYYHKMQAAEFVTDLLNDPKVREVVQVRLVKAACLPGL